MATLSAVWLWVSRKHWKRDDGNRRLAAMYLMTATEPLRRWGAPNLFDLWPTALHEWRVLHGLSGQEYALYQAARGEKMQKTMNNLSEEFGSIRAGRANPHVLDKLRLSIAF